MTEQELKDEREQAVKRGGEIYADHYMEGLIDGRNLALRQCHVSGQLPDFLYEDEGQIRIGYHGDTVVTDEWRKWKEGNLR